MQKKNGSGITLIALVITIIILLILAGVTISLVLGNNGILNRAEDSVKITKIKEAEEFIRMSYMERQIDEIVEGKEATIAGVISDLKEQGYTIKQESESGNSITGIALSEENVTLERNTSKTITYTLIYAEGTIVRYFVEIQGQYYEINFDNGNITINTEVANLDGTKEPEVTVESSDSSIIEVTKTGEGKILLIAKDIIGDVEITVTCGNNNEIKSECIAIVEPPPPSAETTTVTGHTPKEIIFTWEELTEIAKVISNNNEIKSSETEEITISINGKTDILGIGDTTKIKINDKEITVRILGFNHDKLTDREVYGGDNEFAGITFECIDSIDTRRMSGSASRRVGSK